MERGVVENTAKSKSKRFALRIIRLYKYLVENKKEYVLSKQLLRCGTSVGANLTEAERGQSRKDFLAKVYIALKEAAESLYWLELLFESDYLTETEFVSLKNDCEEIIRMLNSTTKTINSTLNSQNSKPKLGQNSVEFGVWRVEFFRLADRAFR